MRVLHVTSARTRRGGENQTFLLAEGLRSRGVETSLVIPEDASYPTPMTGTVRIRFRGETDLPAMRRLSALIGEFSPDLVHAHTGHSHSWAAVALKLGRSPTPLAVSRRVMFSPSGNPVSRWKFRQADMYLCVSRAVARVMLDYGIPPGRVEVVHSGVPAPGCAGDGRGLRDSLGIAPGKLVALSLAAFTPNKNQASLICALSLVPPGSRPVCILAGEGSTRVESERLAQELGLSDTVRFPGFVEDPGELLAASDVFVLSSLSEGLSTSTIEAMACGLPVVATRCGGVEDLVVDGETGLLVPPGSPEAIAGALRQLADSPGGRLAMGAAGRARSAMFGVDRMVDGTLEVYGRMVSG